MQIKRVIGERSRETYSVLIPNGKVSRCVEFSSKSHYEKLMEDYPEAFLHDSVAVFIQLVDRIYDQQQASDIAIRSISYFSIDATWPWLYD
jgi:hypothetical protein